MPSVKATAAVHASLVRLYGSRVKVRYYNVNDASTQAEWGDLLEYFKHEKIPLPVTLLNQKVLFVGGLQPLKVVAAVAEWMDRSGHTLEHPSSAGHQDYSQDDVPDNDAAQC